MGKHVEETPGHAFCGWIIYHSPHESTGLDGQNYICIGMTETEARMKEREDV
jgi:hypothetical protein